MTQTHAKAFFSFQPLKGSDLLDKPTSFKFSGSLNVEEGERKAFKKYVEKWASTGAMNEIMQRLLGDFPREIWKKSGSISFFTCFPPT